MRIASKLTCPGLIYLAEPEECEILGGLLLSFLDFFHTHPIPTGEAFDLLARWFDELGLKELLDPYNEEPCDREEGLYSDSLPLDFAHSATAAAWSSQQQIEREHEDALWRPSTRISGQ